MSATRNGCYACFRTLNPKDKDQRFRNAVKCESCGALYHATCSEGLPSCYRCGQQQFRPIRVGHPAVTIGVMKKEAQTIQPSSVVNFEAKQDAKQEDGNKIGVLNIVIYLVQSLWAILFAFMLIAIAVGIGCYAYRIIQLSSVSASSIMDALFRTAPPSLSIIYCAIASGLISASVFYSRSQQLGRRFICFLAGIVALIGFNLLLFIGNPLNSNSFDLTRIVQNVLGYYMENLWAEGITIAAVLVLTPLHRGLAPVRPLPKRNRSVFLKNIYGWVRLLLTSCVLVLLTINFVEQWLPILPQEMTLFELFPGIIPNLVAPLSISKTGATVISVIIVALFYWPPYSRQVEWRFSILRLLVVIIGVITIGLLYRFSPEPQALLLTIELTSAMMFVMIPIQRALS